MAEQQTNTQTIADKNSEWSAFLCEVCDQPFAECFCYKLCENCELPTNECVCNSFQIQDQKMPQNVQHQNPSSQMPVVNGGICIYFLQGRCTYGENCKYSHGGYGTNNAVPKSTNGGDSGSEVCKFFLSGNCKFGKSCRFSHGMETTKYSDSAKEPRRTNNIPSDHKGSNSRLEAKMHELMDLRDEIALLEDVLSQKREVENALEQELASLQDVPFNT